MSDELQFLSPYFATAFGEPREVVGHRAVSVSCFQGERLEAI